MKSFEPRTQLTAAFLTAVLVALALHADAFEMQVPIQLNPEAGEAGRSIGTLFVAWVVLAHVLKLRWKGAVLADERDRRIEQLAATWGRCATTGAVIGIAVMLAFSPTQRIQQFSYPTLAQMLMFALVLGAWFDAAVATVLYWQDRRAAVA